MSIWSILTGHSDKASDVYANLDKVDIVIEQLNTISTTTVSNARDNVYEAIRKLNNVRGMAEQVGTIQTSGYDAMFQSISDSIKDIGSTINHKVDIIKIYGDTSATSLGKKVGSTLAMTLFKAAEGVLSVGEDLVDGVASVIGWVGGLAKNSKLQDSIASFIKKDYSHDLFNFYYKSDFAKYSAFTEDSALACATRIVGKTAGYIFAGTAVAAGIGGLGHGVETGLNSGMTYNEAMANGAKLGLIQGTLGLAGGVVGNTISSLGQATANEVFTRKAELSQNSTDIVQDVISGKIDDYSASAKGGIFKEEIESVATPTYTLTYTPDVTETTTETDVPTYTPISSIPVDGGSPSNVVTQEVPVYTYTPVEVVTYTPVDTITYTPSIIPSSTYTPEPIYTYTPTVVPTYTPTPIVTPVVTPTPEQIVVTKVVETIKPYDATNETPIVEHAGVSYDPTEGLQTSTKTSNELLNAENLMELDELEEMESEDFSGSSLDSVINGSKLTKIPTATTPTTVRKKGGSSVIPIAAGLSAAAAAAIGAKAYIDHKNNNDFDEDDDDEDDSFEEDEWYDDGDTVDVEYTEADKSEDLSQESYQDEDNSYSAKTHDELADLE